jgi:tagatose-6-phosphate ketose/aldose isomerase
MTIPQHHPLAAELLQAGVDADGYRHTLEEILQQPATWLDTCERLIHARESLQEQLRGIATLVLSGSGSSEFAGECARPALQRGLGMTVQVIDGGALLMHGADAMPPARPALLVSLARSGNSPESVGAVSALLASDRQTRHLVLTCNGDGGLACAHRGDPRVQVVVLDPRTNDRSLVMTSSFTNLVLAARFLGLLGSPEVYRHTCNALAEACGNLLQRYFGTLAQIGAGDFDRVVYLTAGPDRGAAHEASLKMLEMTAGRVATMAETYLGLRHGPMSFVHDRTLIVCFLSGSPYEYDLIRELNHKKLGRGNVLVGEGIDQCLLEEGDHAIEIPGFKEDGAMLHVIVGQLLAFFRCRKEGLKPDSPSERGIINRVVEGFPIYR